MKNTARSWPTAKPDGWYRNKTRSNTLIEDKVDTAAIPTHTVKFTNRRPNITPTLPNARPSNEQVEDYWSNYEPQTRRIGYLTRLIPYINRSLINWTTMNTKSRSSTTGTLLK